MKADQNPKFIPKTREEGEKKLIWDRIRKKYVTLTPEEHVRQFLIYLLCDVHHYPLSLFSLETGIRTNSMNKRYDILVRNREGVPFLLVECKAPAINLNEKALNQLVIYNQEFRAPFIMLFNGSSMFCWQRAGKKDTYDQVDFLPDFPT